MFIHSLIALLLVIAGSLASASDQTCEVNVALKAQAIKQLRYDSSKDPLLFTGRPTEFQVTNVTLTPQGDNKDPEYFDVSIAKITVVGTRNFSGIQREVISGTFDLYNDLRHSCHLELTSKRVQSPYRICREINGYNGRIGNAYDPCVE